MKKELQKTIAINLYKSRTKRGMTRDQVAEKAGISTTFYANLECGKKMMSIVTLRKLADALSVSTDSLLYEEYPNDQINNIAKLLQSCLRKQLHLLRILFICAFGICRNCK